MMTSHRGAVAEVAGPAAELVDPLDVESIAAGMERVLVDRARRTLLIDGGSARSAQFDWRLVASQIDAIVVELASGGKQCRIR